MLRPSFFKSQIHSVLKKFSISVTIKINQRKTIIINSFATIDDTENM